MLYNVISLGAGVQSSTMALMAAHGEITPMPECAIFADTQWESTATYAWLDELEKHLPFPVHRVSAGNLREEQVTARVRNYDKDAGERWASLPYFTLQPGAQTEGRVRRQCTREYKIEPIQKFIRRALLGLAPGERVPAGTVVISWRGISADEAHRMKPAAEKWLAIRYPLALEHHMTRGDCLAWLERHGYGRAPRSSCIGCPFHSDAEWLDMRNNRPAEWADAVAFDSAVRRAGGMRGDTFLHRSCKPLSEVQFLADRQADLWGNECEGMCGV